MSAPNSMIYLCSGVRLDNRYEHTIYFADKSAQESYFMGKVKKTLSAYTYLRKSWPLQVQATWAEARTWSYLFFQNGAGKVYYYFITQVEYKNENMVELTLELDVLQTYLFDFFLQDCYVERNHTTTDTIGEHTLDEGLEGGALIDCATRDLSYTDNLCILIMATINPNVATGDKPAPALAHRYNGVFSGLKIWAVNSDDWVTWADKLEALSEAGFVDGIVNMWMYPKNLVKLGGGATWEGGDLCKPVEGCLAVGLTVTGDNAYTPFGGYTPKNRKLYGFPYNFLYVTNNAQESVTYKYERFANPDDIKLTLYGTVSPEAGVRLVPQNYNGIQNNYDQGLNLGNFPTCAWDSDTYKMWLAQNQNQLNLNSTANTLTAVAGVATAIGSAVMGNVAGAVGGVGVAVGSAKQIAEQVAQCRDMEIQPPQARGTFSAGVNMTTGKQCFTLVNKSIDKVHARVIDDYFTMYGYKIHRVMKPSINARPAFTYVKTVGCKILANMCMEDLTKIEAIFDQGITWWKNGDKICDYTQNNTV